MDKFDDEATWWLCSIIYIYMCLHDHDYVMNFYYMVILRSTTGSYGRPITKVAYGEMLLLLHRSCMGVDSSKRMVGVSTWCRSCWIYPGQHQCGFNVHGFLDFQIINIKYTHMVFKYIYSIKKTLVVSNLILARRGSENVFDRPLVFKI